jgi:integrase
MPDKKYLKWNGSSWIFQKKVTPELAEALGQKSLVYNKSLKTDSLKTAQALRHQELALLQNKDLQQKIKTKYADVRKKLERMNDEELDWEREKSGDELTSEYPHLGSNQWKAMSAEEKLASGLPLSETTEEQLHYELVQAIQNEDENYKPPKKTRLKLQDSFDRVMIEKKNIADKTRISFQSALSSFCGYLGKEASEIYVYNIKRITVKEYILAIRETPKSNGEYYATSTIAKNLSNLNALWKHCRDEEELQGISPFVEQTALVDGKERGVSSNKKKRVNWEFDELKKIIDSIEDNKKLDKLFILIGWYTGARLNEIFSLTAKDIHTEKETGIQYFAIKEEWVGKSVSATRFTPLHKDLISLIKDFKGWTRPTSDSYSKMFTRAKRKQGFTHPKKVFHSIRGNTITNFEILSCPENITAQIVGHKHGGQTMSYGYYSSGVHQKMLKEWVDKLPSII